MSKLKNNFNFSDLRLAGLHRKIPISQKTYCIKTPENILTKEHPIPKIKLLIYTSVHWLFVLLIIHSIQQGGMVQQSFAIDWSSTIPDDLVTIDLISPRGNISIDHWFYIMIINSNV